jgi:hypothetical protein
LSKKASLATLVLRRLDRWAEDRQALIDDLLARSQTVSPRPHPPTKDTEREALAALRIGDVKKALRLLCTPPFAPLNDETVGALRLLHPPATRDVGPPPPPDALPHFLDVSVRAAMATFGPGSSGGLFGYKPLLLQQCLHSSSPVFLDALTRLVNHLGAGRAPSFLHPFLGGGVLSASSKKQGGIRPICCGDPLRRLVSKCFCLGGREEIAEVFKNSNFGVGVPGGVEIVAHSLRDILDNPPSPGLALLKIDFTNAFNLVDRNTFLSAVDVELPGLSPWARWCYSTPSALVYNTNTILTSSCGVHQGDPLGPLLFSLALSPFVAHITSLRPAYNKW